MQVLVVIARIIHRSTLYFAVARNLVYENNTWGKKHLTGRKCQVYTKKKCGKLTITLFKTTWT